MRSNFVVLSIILVVSVACSKKKLTSVLPTGSSNASVAIPSIPGLSGDSGTMIPVPPATSGDYSLIVSNIQGPTGTLTNTSSNGTAGTSPISITTSAKDSDPYNLAQFNSTGGVVNMDPNMYILKVPIGFGDQYAFPVLLTNTSAYTADSFRTQDDNDRPNFKIDLSNCQSLAAGATCAVTMIFAPQTISIGLRNKLYTISYTLNGQTYSFQLTYKYFAYRAYYVIGAGVGGGPRTVVSDLYNSQASYTYFNFGTSSFTGGVAEASADINGDGQADIISSAMRGGNRIQVIDGKNPSTSNMLLDFQPFPDLNNSGASVAAGDLTGNRNFVIVAGQASCGSSSNSTKMLVRVFAPTLNSSKNFVAGAAPTKVLEFEPYPSQCFSGGLNVALADLEGDGTKRIVVSPSKGGAPNVRVFNKDGSPYTAFAGGSFYGFNDPSFMNGAFVTAGPFCRSASACWSASTNSDGTTKVRDVIITSAANSGGPRVGIMSKEGMLADFFIADSSLRGGVTIAAGYNYLLNGFETGADLVTFIDILTQAPILGSSGVPAPLSQFHMWSSGGPSTIGTYVAISAIPK